MSEYKNYYYAAYGSNLNLEQMSNRCPDARYIGNLELNDYQLTFRSNCRAGVMNMEKGKGKIIVGLFEVTARDEAHLDSYEGYPYLYVKRFKTVKLEDGDTIRIMYYKMKENSPLCMPSLAYYNVVVRGYADCHVPMEQLFEAYDSSLLRRKEDLYA